MKETIAVLGGGSWGATLAGLLAEQGHSVALWEYVPAIAEALKTTRKLATVPDLKLPDSVLVTNDMAAALAGRPWIVSATPSAHVRFTLKAAQATGQVAPEARVISVSKGLEDKTLKRMSEVIAEEFRLPLERIVILTGPSHAEEVCRKLPTAVVAAGKHSPTVKEVQALFSNAYLRVYSQEDWIGAELAGALKNVMAIGCGIADGLGFGDNTRAALLTRGLNEITRLGVQCGARQETFFGLAGMGDLIVTCLSVHSRNHTLGEKIGRGKTPKAALAEMTMVAEGMVNAPAAQALAEKLGVSCPLIQEIYAIPYQNKNPKESLQTLMQRAPQEEWHD
jgi:glycerol-3-phosphate dehydrogenase (NAD(P)+)